VIAPGDARAAERAALRGHEGGGLAWLPRGTVLRLLVIASIYFLASGLSSVFVPIFLYDLGHQALLLPIEVMAVVFAVMGTTGLWLQPLVHPNYRRLLPVGILAMGAFQLSLGYVQVWWLLGISYGLGLALFWTTFNTYLFVHTGGPRRIEQLTLLYVAIPGVAGVIGPGLGGFLASSKGLHLGLVPVFLLAGLLFVVASALATGLPAPSPAAIPVPSEVPASAFRHPEFRRYAGAFYLSGLSDTSWIVYPLLLYFLAGSSLLGLGLASSVIALFTATISPLLARWADRRSTVWVPAALGYGISVVWLLGLAFTTTLWEAVVLGLCSAGGGLQSSVLRGYTDLYPESALASASVQREVFIEAGRLTNLALVALIVGTATVSFADLQEYYLVVGTISLSIPAWIVATRLGSAPSTPQAPGTSSRS
jgi:MFS family permease